MIVVLAVAWYGYRHRLPLVKALDAIAPGALVGIAIADVAALLTGRNAGAPSTLPWAVNLWGVTASCADLRGRGRAGRGRALLWMIAHAAGRAQPRS